MRSRGIALRLIAAWCIIFVYVAWGVAASAAGEATPGRGVLQQEPRGKAEEKPPEKAPEKPAEKAKGKTEEEGPAISGVEVPVSPNEFYLPNQPPGHITRVSPQGIHLIYTDVESGYKTTVTAKRAVTWITPAKTVGPDGREKEARQVEMYAEGDVILIQKDLVSGVENKAYCETLYFDFLHRRGVILKGWFKVYAGGPERTHLYLTAREIREIASDDVNTTRLKLYDAVFTNDEYGRPVANMGAKTLEIEQKRNQTETRLRAPTFVRFYAKNVFARIRNVPVFYMPFVAASSLNHYFIQSFRAGHSSRYGFFVMTRWNLQDLGLMDNDWSDLSLRLDEYSKRGLGEGLNFDYERHDFKGMIEGYHVHDSGVDRVGPLRIKPPTEDRYRFRADHKQDLGDGWKADVGVSKISDRGFLREYFRPEFDQATDQDTSMSVWRTDGHMKISGMGRGQANSFLTSTEYLPRVRASAVSWPILGDRLYASFDTQVADVRRHFDEALGLKEQEAVRADLNTELRAPIALGIIRVSPYLGLRGTYYDRQATRPWRGSLKAASDRSTGRFTGYAGFDASTQFSRAYDRFLIKKRVNHVVRPYVRLYDVFANTRDPRNLIQADSVDMEDKRRIWTFGVRQLFQTKHMEAGKERSFDAVIVDLQYNHVEGDPIAFFTNPAGQRNTDFEHGLRMTDNFKGNVEWNVYRSLTLFGEAEYTTDVNSFGAYDCGFHLYPSERTSLTVRDYFVRNDGTSNFTEFTNIFPYEIDRENTFFPFGRITDYDTRNVLSVNYQWEASEKWALGIYYAYDFARSRPQNSAFVVRRYFHKWVLDMAFHYNRADNNTSVSVGFAPRELAKKFIKRPSGYEAPAGSGEQPQTVGGD